MALSDTNYRLHIDWTYSSTGNANTALSAINSALASAGRPETATRTSNRVELVISGLTESEANTLRISLTSAWSASTRSYGKAAVARSNDTS
jgi:hypothetical protein